MPPFIQESITRSLFFNNGRLKKIVAMNFNDHRVITHIYSFMHRLNEFSTSFCGFYFAAIGSADE